MASPTVIRAGESAPQANLETLKSKDSKTFYHMVPGASFIMPDGLQIVFLGGQFVTGDKEIIRELSVVADKASSMIYTKRETVDAVVKMADAAAKDAVQNLTPEK